MLGYLLLTGTLPFSGNVVEILMSQIHNAPDPLGVRRKEDIDPALESLILRAMAKDPAQRHASASAFRYELNTVMDMLDMGRRRGRGSQPVIEDSTRDGRLAQAFERSPLPQALISIEGTIVTCNRAFKMLINMEETGCDGTSLGDTALASFVPGLLRALRMVHVDGKPAERRARVFRGADVPALELVIWLAPLPIPGSEIHMLVRVDEVDAR